MVRTQLEVEVEVESTTGEIEPMVTIEEEEDVVLFWDNGRKSKSVRELASGAVDGKKEDQLILSYYRLVMKDNMYCILSQHFNDIFTDMVYVFICNSQK